MLCEGKMSRSYPIVDHSIKNYDKLIGFCRPLIDQFAVNHFWYHKVTYDGYFRTIGTHIDWTDYMMSDQRFMTNAYLRHPDNYQTGISLTHKIKDPAYQEMVKIIEKKFNLNFAIAYLEKTHDGVQGFGFAAAGHFKEAEELYIQDFPLLNLFIGRFKEEFKSIIQKLDDDAVLVGTPTNSYYHKKEKNLHVKVDNRKSFLEKLGVKEPNHLTLREKDILSYMLKGYSVSQIADMIHRSKRTIEHQIEALKDKLDCYSKQELIEKAHEFALLGYII